MRKQPFVEENLTLIRHMHELVHSM